MSEERKKAEALAQWVIDNRYPKSENNKVSDLEMYHKLVEEIQEIRNMPILVDCTNCKHQEASKYVEPCYGCNNFSNHQIKNANNF